MHSDLEIYFVACDHTKPARLHLFRALAVQAVSISLRSSDAFWLVFVFAVFMILMELDDMTGHDLTGWYMIHRYTEYDIDSPMALILLP